MARYVKMHRLPNETSTPGFRAFEKKDIDVVTEKLNKHLSQYKLHIQFTKGEVEHFLIP